jgi:hypothetical protein
MSNQDEVIALTLGLAVTARILPETWLPKDVREDLGFIFAFLAVVVSLLGVFVEMSG